MKLASEAYRETVDARDAIVGTQEAVLRSASKVEFETSSVTTWSELPETTGSIRILSIETR